MRKSLPSHLLFLLKTYALGLVFFSLFRLILVYLNWDLFLAIPDEERSSLLFKSLVLGLRFDTLSSVYFLGLPFLVLSIGDFFSGSKDLLYRISHWLLSVLYGIGFFASAVDIPYFLHFNFRLNSAALMWIDEPEFVIEMVAQEPSYWLAFLPFLLVVFLFARMLRGFSKTAQQTERPSIPYKSALGFLLSACVLFVALRGKIDFSKAPLGPIDAYFSDYSVANQMSLNPVFSFLKSYVDAQKASNRDLKLMDSEKALQHVKEDLQRSGTENSPIAEWVQADSSLDHKPNVVLVIMEGLSAVRMNSFGSKDSCTPFLDSLAGEGVLFKNIYSAGIHTHNGIYGTLTGFPALFERHAMKQIPIPRYNSLPVVLKKQGYQTCYITNHDVEFDNAGGFVTENGINQLISDRNYPPEKLLSTLGVADDYMFSFAMPELNRMGAESDPFLAIFMTTSNHKPYHFPENYTRRFQNEELDGYAYADWSIKQLIQEAKKQDWFENTLFVFVADHGWAIAPQYDLSLNHSHVPLIFYGEKYLKPQVEEKMGGQIDVFPTIMGLLQLPYENASLGIDLFQENRPYMYFNGDNKFGVIDQDYLYIYRKDGPEGLYHYPGSINEIETLAAKADSMKRYGMSHMQVAHDRIKNGELGKR